LRRPKASGRRRRRHFGASQAEGARQGFAAKRDDEILDPLMAQARSALGGERFAAAESAGLATDYEQAVAAVRAWLESQ
jgi:hypothetical protein